MLASTGLDLSSVRFCAGTKTTLVIEIKQARQKIPSNSITAREGQRLQQDLAVHLVGALVVERRQTRQHLVEPDTKGSPIRGLYESITK